MEVDDFKKADIPATNGQRCQQRLVEIPTDKYHGPFFLSLYRLDRKLQHIGNLIVFPPSIYNRNTSRQRCGKRSIRSNR